jgi:hypothetical protein
MRARDESAQRRSGRARRVQRHHRDSDERRPDHEVDEATGALFVDRFMSTSMHYPCNYGYIPQTLADDDPVDVLVSRRCR